MTDARKLTIEAGKSATVSALLMRPRDARACYVFAHGAGAGMTHAFMTEASEGLATRGIATLRYQFPTLEKGGERPDPPRGDRAGGGARRSRCKAARACPGLPLIAGGKSFGGRMTSQAQAKAPLADVVGLAFFGFPLHAAGKPSSERADHLADVRVPVLFLQGSADKLAEVDLLKPVVKTLGARATLHLVDGADHSFHVPKRSGRSDREVMAEILDAFAAWAAPLV